MQDQEICEMAGVREYSEGYPVSLYRDGKSGRLAIGAVNEGGHNTTFVDLLDLIEWLSSDDARAAGIEMKER